MHSNLAVNVDAVNQVQLIKLILEFLDTEKVAFEQVAICEREGLCDTGILALDQTFDASVFDNVHERFECATMLVNRVMPTFFRSVQGMTVLMTYEHIVHVPIHVFPNRKSHGAGFKIKRGSRDTTLMNNVDILASEKFGKNGLGLD